MSPVKRQVPDAPWHLKVPAIVGLYGPLIFATIFFEFGYLMDSIWRSYMVYALFAVLLLTLFMMVFTIASLSVVVTYRLLSH